MSQGIVAESTITIHASPERVWEVITDPAAVKEFMERDGALPESIAWVADADVPEDAFPDPYLHRLAGR